MPKRSLTGTILVSTILAFGAVTTSHAIVLPVLPDAVVDLQDGIPFEEYTGSTLPSLISTGLPGGYSREQASGFPSPSINVSLKSSATAYGSADLKYDFEYIGPANLSIPIQISGIMTNSPIAITESVIVSEVNSSAPPLIITPSSLGGGAVIPFDTALNVTTDTLMQIELQAEGASDFNGSPSSGTLAIDPTISISSLQPPPVPIQDISFDESPGIYNTSVSTPEPGLYALLVSLGMVGIGFARRKRIVRSNR